MQDVGPAAQALDEWRPVATNVTTPAYTVNELSPRKDYKFRIREELENGDLSEPTPPIHYYRTQMPMTREPFMLAEYKPVDYTDTTFANRTYVQHLTKFVPPRMPIDKPEMVVINPETVELAWKPARVPEAIRNSSNLTYTIEVRTPPSFDWRELTSGLKVLNHTVKKLHTRIDYVFRVRAWNEYGCSEPGLPVSLYRPKIHDAAAELAEEESWEQDFERRFSQQVPPKLPMDTPKVLTRSPESIWLSWKPARIPAYATQTPITYYIEVKRPPGTSYHREVSGLVDCQYIMEGLNPSQDYSIQVRAETEHGVSDPTLPVLIQRSKPSSRPGSRRSSLERDLAAEEVNLETMRLDNVTAGAPPRMSSHRPLASNVHPDHLTMTWSAARLPSYVKHSQITYIIERRDLPSHVWTVLARDVTDMRYDVKGLSPDTDYMFRVKARNEFGLSEPTLPMSIYRDRDDYVPQKIRSRSDSRDSILSLVGRRGRRGSSVDYTRPDVDDVDVCMRDKIPTQPEYATAVTSDTQYGAEGKKGRISLQVRGFPLPTINWYLNDEKLEYGEGYNAYVTPTGGVTLEINNITPDKIGQYKCFAQNGSGSAIKMIDFRPADPPTVLEPLKDVVSQSYRDVTLTCRADGTPAPTVKWMKDWRPITESSRVTVSQEAPDTWSITLTNVLTADGAVYACSIENMGGKVTSAARLTVEEDAPAIQDISLKTTPIEDAYHILEEVDRDRHSVHRRVIEKATGKSYVAKFISLRNKAQKNFFLSEFEMLRALSQTEGVVTLHDAFETDRSLVLITEPLSGKPVTDQLLADGNWAERDVADVIRRLLGVMTTLQSQDIVHLDIKPSNVWLGGASGRDVIMTGFDLARQLLAEEEITHNYGSVGYTSPEQITDGVISPTTDTWAVGVLAYALLSGALPFDGPTDIDVLQRTKDCLWSFGDDFENISQEGRDFISKLLVKDPRERMTVARCLSHAWLTTSSDSALDVGKLRRLSDADKQERESHSVNTTANLQSLLKLMHGESALYQPAIDQDSGEIIFPDQDEYGDFLDEDAWYEWNLQCRDDPDVQEFPLASNEFRIRESRHTAADDAPSDKETDEHADSEEAGANIMFRNKIQNETFMVGDDVTFSCTVVSPDSPAVVTWYRDETLLSDAYRAEPTFTDDGVARLTIRSAKDYDAGVYKCVARNKDKRVSCQARLLLGDLPGKPGRPVVTQTSGTEVFLTWTGPVSDGNAYLLGYRVDYKAPGDVHWTRGPYVTEDYAIIGGLAPSTEYTFRISCHNKYGTSPYSWASIPITTKDEDAPPITMSSNLAPLLQFSSFSRQQMTLPVESRRPSVTAAEPATTRDGRPEDDYKILDTISRGKFAEYKNCTHIATNTARVMKIVPYTTDSHSDVTHEFETLKSIRQINIVTVIESYVTSENFYVIFERLSGINVIEYLCLRKTYTEEMVARIIRQVMDALQHLKHYGIAHLNLQPSSVVMATRKRLHVKLRDFTQSREIESGKELPMTPAGYTDFIAPEIIQGEPVGHPADVWSLGVLAFALLSGVSPFAGKDIHETLTHVIYGRYSNMDLYDNVSKESAKFINKLLKRIASNRPTINKCLDSRWLHLSDSMMKSRTSRHFRTERLREFQAEYQQRRADDKYTNVGGVKPEDLPKPTVGPLRKPVIHEKIMRRDLSIQLRKSRLPLKTFASAKQVAELSELKSETIESAVKKRNEMATGLATLDTMPDFFIQLNQLKSEMDKLFCSTQSLGDSAETVSKAADVVTKDLEILTTKLEEVKEPEKEFEKQTDNSELEREVNDSDVFDSNVSGKPDLIEISEVLRKQLSESSLIKDVTSSVDDLDDKTVEGLVSKDIRARECDIKSNVIESEENIPSEIESLEMITATDTDNKSTEDTVEQNKDTGACITSEKDRVSPLAPETAAQDVHLEKGDGYIQAETQAAIETVQVVDTGSQLQPSIVNSDETIVPNDTTDDVQKDNFEAHNVAFTEIDEVHVNKPSVVDKPDGRVVNDESTEETKSSELSDDRKISHDSELKISDDVVTTESVKSTKADVCASKVDMTSKTNTQLDELVEEIKPCATVDEKTLSPERDIKTCDEIENVDDKPVSNTHSDELIYDSKASESNNEQHKESAAVANGTRDEEASHAESGESKVNLVEIKDSDILPCEKEDKILADIDTTIDNQNGVTTQDIVEENVIPETRAKPTKSILKKLDDTFALSINKDTPLSLPEEIKLGEAENANNGNIQNEVTTPSTIVSEKSEVVEASEKETAKEQSPEPVEEDNIVPELKPKHEIASSQYFPKDEVRRDSSQAYITPEADSELYFSAEEDVDGVTIGDTATTKPTKAKRVKFDIDISQAVMEKLMQPETNENANTESSSKHYKQVQVESTDDHETVGMETDDTKELEVENKTNQSGDYIAESTSTEDTPITESKYVETSIDNDASKLVEVASGTETQTELASVDDTTTDNVGVLSNSDEYMKTEPLSEDIPPVDRDVEDSRSVKPQSNSTQECKPCESVTDGDIEHTESKPEEAIVGETKSVEIDSLYSKAISTMPMQSEPDALMIADARVEDIQSKAEQVEKNSSIDSKAENVESITDVPKDIQQVAANTESMQTETNSQSDVAIAEHKGAVHVESETEITAPVQVASEDNAHATSEDSNQKELVAKPETKQIDDFKDESEHKDELETSTPDKIDSEIELKKAAAQSQDATDALPIITNVHEDNKTIQVENIDSDLTEAISEHAVSTETNNTTVQTIDNNDSVRVYEERVTHKSSPAPEIIDISPDNGVSSEDCGKYLTESTPEPPNLAEVEAVADRLVTEAIGDALAVAAATE